MITMVNFMWYEFNTIKKKVYYETKWNGSCRNIDCRAWDTGGPLQILISFLQRQPSSSDICSEMLIGGKLHVSHKEKPLPLANRRECLITPHPLPTPAGDLLYSEKTVFRSLSYFCISCEWRHYLDYRLSFQEGLHSKWTQKVDSIPLQSKG